MDLFETPAGTRRSSTRLGLLTAAMLSLVMTSCATAGTAPPSGPTEEEWRLLAAPRPMALPGAARISLAGVELGGEPPWTFAAPLPPDLAIAELVVAGLLRRRDVDFVERRRFSAAAEAERAGRPRRRGAPPVGVSRGAELTVTAVWLPESSGRSVIDVRITDSATGAVAGARRADLPADPDAVGVARATVNSILATLDDMGRLPEWRDPVPEAAPASYRESEIPDAAVQRFLLGLAAEEQWNWEGAGRSYEAAASSAGFVEAATALARTARLRSGGTLGDS